MRTPSDGTPRASYAPSSTTTPCVSVPVLSVQRTSMLPRFSIAVRCRTSTPSPRHHLRAAGEIDAQDGRQQLGAEPDGERDRKQQRLHRRPSVQHVHDEDDHDHDQHHAGQQVAEPADPAVELRFRRPQRQAMRDGAELGLQAGRRDQAARRAAPHVGAEKDAIQPVAQPGGGGHRSRSLLNREALAGQDRLADEEVGRLENHAIRGNQAAGRQQDHIAWHDLLGRHVHGLPIAQHARSRTHARLQGRRRRLRVVLARVADAHRRQHDDEHDDGIHPLPGHGRRRRREDQHPEQRVSDLIHDHPHPREATVLANLVRSMLAKPPRGLGSREALRAEPSRLTTTSASTLQ